MQQLKPKFPLAGVMLWSLVFLVGLSAPMLMYSLGRLNGEGLVFLVSLFVVFFGISGLALFFSSAYAQQKWNPEGL